MAKRVRSFLLFPVALSPNSLATVLQIDRRRIDHAIKYEGLTLYRKGKARRILIEDAVKWVRQYWEH